MIRARFKTDPHDARPVNWPIKHPYWITGFGEGYSIVVAYADDKDEILRNWPDATEIEFADEDGYFFSERFPKPRWMEE